MVHKFVCVYLKKHNQLSQDALYRKTMQYGFKLSKKHPSETINNFENSYLISIIYLVRNKTFYIIPMFCNRTNIGLKCFADIRFGIFLVQIDSQK